MTVIRNNIDLALFDFDGTITHSDTFTKFVLFATDAKRLKRGKLLLLPEIIAYKSKLSSGKRIRRKMFDFGFKDTSETDITAKAEYFAINILSDLIRPEALARMKWHQDRGDEVIVVSASLDLYLRPWCTQYGIQLICNQVEIINGKLTGNFIGHDCSANEKSRRVESAYNLDSYNNIYAYSDTVEDKELLQLANYPFYRHF